MTVVQLSTVFARAALLLLCLVIVVTAPRRSVRLLGAFGAVLLTVSLVLFAIGTPLVSAY